MTSPMDRTGPSIARGKSKQDYGTPRDFIAAVEHRFGELECDLAASIANSKARTHIDEARDSLQVPWPRVHCWLNPPYDRIAAFAEKCSREWALPRFIHMLVPASIGTEWFSHYVRPVAVVEGLSPRLTFEGCSDPYPKDLMLCTYGYGLTGFGTWRWK